MLELKKKNKKNFSTLQVTNKMQNKATVQYSTRMAKMNKTDVTEY